MTRAFFGLSIPAKTGYEIERWRDSSFPPFEHPVGVENFHITLCFLGEINQRELRQILADTLYISQSAFALRLDRCGYFEQQKIFHLTCSHVPSEIKSLSSGLGRMAARRGLRISKQHYVPHVTLARRCATARIPLNPPGFEIDFNEFHLYESVRRSGGGVQYEELKSWPLF